MQTSTNNQPLIDWLPYLRNCNTFFDKNDLDSIEEWLRLCYENANKYSPDKSTKLYAVILDPGGCLSESCNTFPGHIQITEERLNNRDLKLKLISHAEEGAICEAAREGKPVEGTTMICPWYSCNDCAKAILKSGVRTMIGHKAMFDNTPDRWRESIIFAINMLQEGGVMCYVYDQPLGMKTLFNGQLLEV